MVLLKALVSLTVLGSYVSAGASFGFITPSLHEDTPSGSSKKRDGDHEERGIGFVTLPLKQNIPDVEIPHDVRLRRVIDRAIRKYSGRNSEEAEVEKRANNYKIVNSITPTQANSAALYQDGTDYSYFAEIKFGSNGTPMYMLMDTGASSTWVMGKGCTTAACQTHNTFGAADSKTFQASTETFTIGYGTGNVNGTYATDKVSFAGFDLTMAFGVSSYTSNEFSSFPMDGIMGLARTVGEKPTVMDVIINSKVLSSNIFGVNINRNSDGSRNGAINFGAPDKTKYVGELGYTACTNSKEWILKPDDVGINGKGVGVTSPRKAYIDTGTSFIFLPPDDAKLLFATITGAKLSTDGTLYTVPCSTTTSIQFFFSGVAYAVSSKDWVGDKTADTTMCKSNIYPIAVISADSWLLGDTFLKNVYAVFDADLGRIGFGLKSAAAIASASSSSPTISTSSARAASSSTNPSSTRTNASTATSTGSSEPFNAYLTSSTAVVAVSQSSASTAAASTPVNNSAAAHHGTYLPAAFISVIAVLLCTVS